MIPPANADEVYWPPVNMVNAATCMLVGTSLESMKAMAKAQGDGNEL
jgi:hypothetical protein